MMEQVAVSLMDLLDEEMIRKLATPANFRSGQAILQIGRIDMIELSPDRICARVTGGQRRRVSLWIAEGQLQWRCSCTLKQHHIFCKHCVALALVTIKRTELADSSM